MKKNYSLFLMTLSCAITFGFGQSDLIISQYIETNSGSTPKGIEIFNVSGAPIVFSAANNLEIFQGTNGAACSSLVDITAGTLGTDQVWVIGTSDLTSYAITNGTNLSGTTTQAFLFNGDDALRVELGGVVQDMFGLCGNDPGSSWTGGGVDTRNNNLQIQNGICDGDIDGWNDPSTRFDQIANGSTMTGFGNAPASCLTCTDTVDFCNLQFPGIGTITLGDNFAVYGQVFEPGVTPGAGQGAGITAEIGFSTTNTDPSTWTDWIPATYNPACADCNGGQNDEYVGDLGIAIPTAGTYYYALRYSLNSCTYSYGGILADGSAGNFWDGTTYISGVLTVNNPPPADVVITEIMYNSTGTDDEWIEICNVSGSPQVLNGHSIQVGGTTQFTFPSSGVTINDGTCITIALGDSGDATFNPDCPFTPDYTNGAGTGTLNNTSDTITLIASDGSTVVDTVTYNSSDGGNTDSLHVIDIALDNSITSTNYWEVINGGSPGINSLISPCTPIGPEINVEGTTANFPDIADGDTTPAAFDGTDFGNVPVFGTSTNTFRIENFGGTQNLTISSVIVASGDVGDFSISSLPSSPITPADPNGFSNFDVEFSPTTIGPKTAVIEIVNNDSDENPYTFTVTGNAECVANTIVATPSSGPVDTVVTITGTNLSTATATFNGLAATVNNISATEMEVTVPSGAISGNLEIIDDLGCPGSTPFTVINTQISSCEGSSGTIPTNLFISEVTDANTGGLSYIEIYNGTGVTINLSGYSIQFFNNGSTTQNGGLINLDNVNLASGNTYIVGVSTGSSCTGITGADGSLADQTGFGGVNFGVNSDDHIRLYDGATHIDSWGVHTINTWADTLGIGSEGVVFTRNTNAANLPDVNFNITDWSYVDWASCSDNDYSDIGNFDFSTGVPPTVTLQPTDPVFACTFSASLTIAGTEAYNGPSPADTQELAYQWYYNAPGDANWTEILPADANYSGQQSATLDILDTFNLDGYQFYCQLREDSATCYEASNAVMLDVLKSVWDGTSWSELPAIDRVAIIDGNYNTSAGGSQTSFEACNLIVNDNATLTIDDGTYVRVENNLTVNGANAFINVEPEGSFVQNNDSGTVTATTPTNITVSKLTAPSNNWYEYTYWSSPVFQETVANFFTNAHPWRRYQYNAQYYRDSFYESNNDNTLVSGPGVDDIDDQAPFDWDFISTTYLEPGVGYASTHDPSTFTSLPGCPGPTCRVRYTFSGLFNNGVVQVPLYRNDSEPNDTNWNFVGNPYPSAISADAFLAINTGLVDETISEPSPIVEGAIYLWSQSTPPSDTTNGNEVFNFSDSDYAIINGTGQTAAQTNGGDSTIPNRYIPSGQGFFIAMSDTAPSAQVLPSPVAGDNIQTADLVFNNSMRTTGNNDQFFRNSTDNADNKLWINLTSDNGVFSQVLVGYIPNATDDYDGMFYDAPRNTSAINYSMIYTLIPQTNKVFAIQGKNPNSLNLDEVIPLGFLTAIEAATVYTFSIEQFEGTFMNDNDIFIVDHLANTIHNLKTSDYSFTSEVGEFNNRFKIVFTPEALSVDDEIIDSNDLIITEISYDDVQFNVGRKATIARVEIMDMLGRTIYDLQGNSASETYNLSKLSKATYIARVTLSNGQTISKKAIKRK